MEVSNDGNVATFVRRSPYDLGNSRCRLVVVDGDAHELRSGPRQCDNLIRGGRRVGGIRVRHRLNDDRMAAADGDTTNPRGGGVSASTKGHDVEGVDER